MGRPPLEMTVFHAIADPSRRAVLDLLRLRAAEHATPGATAQPGPARRRRRVRRAAAANGDEHEARGGGVASGGNVSAGGGGDSGDAGDAGDVTLPGEMTVNDLRASFSCSQSALSQHLAVLRRAGLVKRRKSGRRRLYRVNAEPLRELANWVQPFEPFWAQRLENLGKYLDRQRARKLVAKVQPPVVLRHPTPESEPERPRRERGKRW